MLNEQLLAYIRQQVLKGSIRHDIAKALIVAGWKIDEVNTALVALSVPMDDGSSTGPAPDLPPSPSQEAQPISTSVVAPSVPSRSSSEKLPGVFALLESGLTLYKKRWRTFLVLGLLALLPGVFILAFSIFGALAFAYVHPFLSIGVLITCAALAVLALALLSIWLIGWFSVAPLHLVRSPEVIGVNEALRRARPQAFSFIWIVILYTLIFLGGFIVVAVLGGVIYLLASALAGSTVFGIILGTTVAIIGIVFIFGTFLGWFSFATWVLVDQGTRGFSALRMSKHIAGPRMLAIAGRTFGIGICIGILSFALSFLLGLVLPQSLAGLLRFPLDFMVFYPIMYSALYTLYQKVKEAGPVEASAS